MSSETTLHDAAIILSKLANSSLWNIPGIAIPNTTGTLMIEDLAVIEASTSRQPPPSSSISMINNQLQQSVTSSKKNSTGRKKSKSPRIYRRQQSRDRSRTRTRSRSNSVGNNIINNGNYPQNIIHPIPSQQQYPQNSNLIRQNNQLHQQQQSQSQSSGRRSSSSNGGNGNGGGGGKHIKFALNNLASQSSSSSMVQYVPRVYRNSGFVRNQTQLPRQRSRSNSESSTINYVGNNRSNRSNQQGHVMKPGMSNDFVSREIMDYYQRNRQTNEKYKAKQILRQSLENTLKQSFPNYIVNLHIIGSTTNGIGDNVSAVDICVLARKKPILTTVPPTSPASSVENLATTEQASEESSKESIKDIVENDNNDNGDVNGDDDDEPISSVKDLVGEKDNEKTETETKDNKDDEKIVMAVADSNTNDDSTNNNNNNNQQQQQQQEELTLKSIEKILQTKNFAKNIVLIPAKVPVIKFKDIICDLDVTLNLNQEVSIRNTQLIRDYSKMDWRFPPLATIVKQWARENRINCAVDKTISPYSWTLMVIHYLQAIEQPVLPCLQKMFPQRYDINLSIEEEMNSWRQPPGKWISKNNSTLKQLLKGLFRYFGYVFDYDQHIISIREGKVLNRLYFQSNRSTNNNHANHANHGSSSSSSFDDNTIQWNSYVCVEEPFNLTNTTRSVHDQEKFERIIELLRMSSNALKGNRISLYNIIIDDLDFPVKKN